MATYRTQVLTTKTPEEVFDYIADFSNSAEWDPSVLTATREAEGELTEGETFDLQIKMRNSTIPMTYVLKAVERPSRAVLASETDRLRSVDTISVRETPAGTVLDYQAKLTLKGALGFLDPILGIFFKRIGDAAAEGLREQIT